jgi:hypothetical protein
MNFARGAASPARRIAVIAALALALAGCASHSHQASAPTPTPTTTAAASSPTPSPTASGAGYACTTAGDLFTAPDGQPLKEAVTLDGTTAVLTGTTASKDFQPHGLANGRVAVTTGASTTVDYALTQADGVLPQLWSIGGAQDPATAQDGALCLLAMPGGAAPVALVATTTGGAHCCTTVHALVPNPSDASEPTVVDHDFGDFAPGLEQTPAGPIFVTADDAFSYEFASFAGSYPPIRLLSFTGKQYLDVTRDHPDLVQADAARHWTAFTSAQDVEPLGALAGWAADECLLDPTKHATQMWQTLQQLNTAGKLVSTDGYPAGQAFIDTLRGFLAKYGYCTPPAS